MDHYLSREDEISNLLSYKNSSVPRFLTTFTMNMSITLVSQATSNKLGLIKIIIDHGTIQRYVQQKLSDDKALAKWNKDAAIRQEIEAALTHGAHGMYVCSRNSPQSQS